MPTSVQQALPPMELNRVDRLDREDQGVVNKVDRLADVPIQMAKARVGAAVKHAIGEQGAKQYGDKGLISNVTSGEKVPEYLARIYADPEARRRFALAWLEGAEGVELETTVRIKRTA